MVTPAVPGKATGSRSTIPRETWETALYEYYVLDRSAREIGAEIGRDHSTVIRMLQGMQRRDPDFLDWLREVTAPAHDSAGQAHDSEGSSCVDSTPTRRRKAS